MSLLSGSIQPPLLSILSSTSSPSISPLWICHTDNSKDSLITTLPDTDEDLIVAESSLKTKSKGCLQHNVIHIQSPNPLKTYIQAGISKFEYLKELERSISKIRTIPLGIKLPYFNLQIKKLNSKKEIIFEIGFLNDKSKEGIIRFSSYKNNPTCHPFRNPPLINLPIKILNQNEFSTISNNTNNNTLTKWLNISINLNSLLNLFKILPRSKKEKEEEEKIKKRKLKIINNQLPSEGKFQSITYIKIYANCRIRRIWFSEEGEKTLRSMSKNVQDEWELYAADKEV
uniref:CFA20 domain-containing protein n=1 Tax=Kwoniella pini CBS 10737 TaxID=1296096 RepID=A0A1B9I0Y7_9TREE|nr:uncharacterized protein I206_04815 [Kwoniella pini CBS 10737]OCF49128.1 hypothetical protein I206_04815 [Kwoniella pini CBS 10737]